MQLNMGVLGRIGILLAKRVGTDWIDTQRVPGNVLNILFDGNLPTLEVAVGMSSCPWLFHCS